MRILTLTPFYPCASDDARGCFVAEPTSTLQALGIESCVIAVEPFYRQRSSPNGHPAQWVRYAAIPGGLGLASSGVFLYERLKARVRRLHLDREFDLIHAHAALPCGHAAELLSGELHIPFVVTAHGLDVFFTAQVSGYPGRWCKNVAESVYRSAARVICISQRVADQVQSLKGANATVIHNGVDQQRFSPRAAEAEAVILSVGNLIPTKGHQLLLRAFAAVHEHYPNVSCEIIGDGPESSNLTGLAARLNIADKVHFLGRKSRQQVAEAMRRCTIFALPSRYEGLGCVYLEAMSAGKPVIACRGQGIEDVIRDENNGWLVSSYDLNSMVNALSTLLSDKELRRRIGDAARATILGGFTLRHQAARLAQLYKECLA